jgi:endonuclease-3
VSVPIARILKELSGRYPLTMLGGWSERRVSPFRTLIGTILSARSRDEMTDVITEALFKRYPTARALARADRRRVEKILKPIGFYRTKASYVQETARTWSRPREGDGFADDRGADGVSRRRPQAVANCVLVYAFGAPGVPVGHPRPSHVSARCGWMKTRRPRRAEAGLVGPEAAGGR